MPGSADIVIRPYRNEDQAAALTLYRASGFTEMRQEVAQAVSNKTVGGGIRRYHFEKWL